MDFSAVVIWYNPKKENIENVITYSSFFDKIYIVDNSSYDNKELISGLEKIEYIPLLNNEGIAKALNIGCLKALTDGFTWCMTMDQDSSWDYAELNKFLIEIKKESKHTGYVSFSPSICVPENTTSYLGDLKRKIRGSKKIKISENLLVDRVICSGNIINLHIWKDIGKFRESFFIDEVDSEFCYRLLENGFFIAQICSAQMKHVLGTPKKTLFPRAENHCGVRLFYITRNKLFINKEYPIFAKKYHYMGDVRRIFLQKLFELKFKDVKYIIQGVSAYWSDINGCYENYITRKD